MIAALTAAGRSTATAKADAAYNRSQMANNISWMMEGTSMAAPMVTGLIACMLAAEPNLTLEDVRLRVRAAGVLRAAAATSFKPGAPDANDWGPGLLNAPKLKP